MLNLALIIENNIQMINSVFQFIPNFFIDVLSINWPNRIILDSEIQ